MSKGRRLTQAKYDRVNTKLENIKNCLLQKATYDELFFVKNDPHAANMLLLVFEIETYFKNMGVKPSFGNFTSTGEQLSGWMDKNRDILKRIFAHRFPVANAYSFTGNIESSYLSKFFKKLSFVEEQGRK